MRARSISVSISFIAKSGLDATASLSASRVTTAQVVGSSVITEAERGRRRIHRRKPAARQHVRAIADPRIIRAGEPWQARIIQRLTGGVFADNFEGLAYVPSASDPARGSLWLIADDNFSVFQRNVLVRFEWDASAADNEKAPGNPDA